jgi:DNA-binding response OmpR family regulator
LKEKKVLIVEDDPDHADLVLDIFDTENIECEVVLIKDGQEAIDYFQDEIQSQVSLVILDLNLPKIDGMEVLKFIKKDSKYSSIPVVILSTSSDQNTISEAYKNGANGYVTKPMSYDEFVDKVKMLRRYLSDTNTLPPQA